MQRRTLVAAAAVAPWAIARAQTFPTKPLRLIVGYTAGGAVDTIARAIGQQMQAGLGQPVLIDNRPGAGTNLAVRALIDSPADGYTLMLAANALAANVTLYQPPPYGLPRDVTPVALVGRVPVRRRREGCGVASGTVLAGQNGSSKIAFTVQRSAASVSP